MARLGFKPSKFGFRIYVFKFKNVMIYLTNFSTLYKEKETISNSFTDCLLRLYDI